MELPHDRQIAGFGAFIHNLDWSSPLLDRNKLISPLVRCPETLYGCE